MTSDQLFKVHCDLRPSTKQTATLQGFGLGWSGAIIFVGDPGNRIDELTGIVPFSKMAGSHWVERTPVLLPSLLQKMAATKPLYGHQWERELLAIEGFSAFKESLEAVSESARTKPEAASSCLQEAIERLLSDDLLDKLLAHEEIIGALRKVRDELAQEECPSEDAVNQSVRSVRHILRVFF